MTDGSEIGAILTMLGSGEGGLPAQLGVAQKLIEGLPVPVFFKGRDGIYLGVNKAWESFFGIRRETIVGHPLDALYPQAPAVAQRHRTMDEELWRCPGSQHYEITVPRSDGALRHTLYYKATFTDERGAVAGLIGTIIDITERKQAEQALRESEARFRSLTELSSDWYWEQDAQYRFTMLSRGIHDSIGVPPEELIGKRRWDAQTFGISGEQWAEHQALLEARQPFRDLVYGCLDAAGKVRYLSTSGHPVFDEQGNFRGYRGMGKDVTARIEAEQALREAHASLELQTRELARSNAELEQFAYVASHDLQEPLRMVASYTQLLLRRYGERFDGDAREFMDYVVDGASRMKQLIEDLLAYSRVGTRGKEFRRVPCEAILHKALANLRIAIEQNAASVTHDALPEVVVDDVQWMQLFQNLIGNAVKFRGERPPAVHVSVEARQHEWLFAVRDNGIGIEPQYYERIFMVFQRLAGRTEYPGTGIGLAICKKVVERHGGRIWVESQPGCGSTFFFTLPKREGENHA